MAPKMRAPVDVRARPTSRKHLKGRRSSPSISAASVSLYSPSASSTPVKCSARSSLERARRAIRRPVE